MPTSEWSILRRKLQLRRRAEHGGRRLGAHRDRPCHPRGGASRHRDRSVPASRCTSIYSNKTYADRHHVLLLTDFVVNTGRAQAVQHSHSPASASPKRSYEQTVMNFSAGMAQGGRPRGRVSANIMFGRSRPRDRAVIPSLDGDLINPGGGESARRARAQTGAWVDQLMEPLPGLRPLHESNPKSRGYWCECRYATTLGWREE
jgi:hypothetical protein